MARVYAECLVRHTSRGRLVAVTGGRRAVELAAAYGAAAEPDIGSILGRRDVNAVIVATPEMRHCEQTLAAAAAGRHVLVEKPMAPTVAECDAMIAACARAGVKLMVVKHWRFRGVHVRALDLLRSGGAGALRSVRNHTLSPRSASLATAGKKPFYLDPAGGGLLMGWAVHNLDWVRCLAGAVPRCVAATLTPAAPPLGEGEMAARIEFANAVVADVRVAIDLPADPGPDQVFRTEIEAERASFDLDGYGKLRRRDATGEEVLWAQPSFDPRNPTDPLRLEAFARMLQGFIDCIGQDTSPPVSGRDGRMAVALFEAARRSSRIGLSVELV